MVLFAGIVAVWGPIIRISTEIWYRIKHILPWKMFSKSQVYLHSIFYGYCCCQEHNKSILIITCINSWRSPQQLLATTPGQYSTSTRIPWPFLEIILKHFWSSSLHLKDSSDSDTAELDNEVSDLKSRSPALDCQLLLVDVGQLEHQEVKQRVRGQGHRLVPALEDAEHTSRVLAGNILTNQITS